MPSDLIDVGDLFLGAARSLTVFVFAVVPIRESVQKASAEKQPSCHLPDPLSDYDDVREKAIKYYRAALTCYLMVLHTKGEIVSDEKLAALQNAQSAINDMERLTEEYDKLQRNQLGSARSNLETAFTARTSEALQTAAAALDSLLTSLSS